MTMRPPHWWLFFLLVTCSLVLGTGSDWWARGVQGAGRPVLRYDKARYAYEDKLIQGLVGPHHSGNDYMGDPELPLPQPLNFRLPVLPTRPPRFLGPTSLNLTGVIGTTVVLPCRVTDLGSASLSWVRLAGPSLASSHLTVLSSGTTLFSSSPRLSLLHAPDSPDWTLQIGPLLARDQGTYECQANTEPKLSRVVELSVVLPGREGPGPPLALQGEEAAGSQRPQRTSILSPSVLHPQPGDTVTLECVVTEHPVAPAYFTWYLLGAPLDFSQHRGGIFLQEETRTHSSSSRITLTRLQVGDSGDYTCSPAGSANATVRVVVATRTVKSYFSSTASCNTAPQLLLVLALAHTGL